MHFRDRGKGEGIVALGVRLSLTESQMGPSASQRESRSLGSSLYLGSRCQELGLSGCSVYFLKKSNYGFVKKEVVLDPIKPSAKGFEAFRIEGLRSCPSSLGSTVLCVGFILRLFFMVTKWLWVTQPVSFTFMSLAHPQANHCGQEN